MASELSATDRNAVPAGLAESDVVDWEVIMLRVNDNWELLIT